MALKKYTGRLFAFNLLFNFRTETWETEIYLAQTSDHKGEDYGHIYIPTEDIKSIDVVFDYSFFKETTQEASVDADKIKIIMEIKGWNAYRLAKESGQSKSIISKILNGNTREVALSTAITIADALDVSINDLIIARKYIPHIRGYIKG